MGRNAILSGYPLFPTTIGGLHVDWRMPASAVHKAARRDYAWARFPGRDPTTCSARGIGFTGGCPKHFKEFDFVAPLTLFACLVPSLSGRGSRDTKRRTRTAPMLAVALPALATLGAWFLVAPDPRFVWGPLWLVPIALVAWALPSTARWPSVPLLVAAVVVAGGLIKLGTLHSLWLVPAALGIWALAAAGSTFARSEGTQSMLGTAAIVSVALAAIGYAVHVSHAFDVVRSNQAGPFAKYVPHIPTETIKTSFPVSCSNILSGTVSNASRSSCARPTPPAACRRDLRLRGTTIRRVHGRGSADGLTR